MLDLKHGEPGNLKCSWLYIKLHLQGVLDHDDVLFVL